MHWGALDPDKQRQEFEFFLKFVEKMADKIDLLVINGDYFDYKLPLNSRSSIYAINAMQRIVDMSYGVDYSEMFKIRIVRGTKSHDEDQLDVFNGFETVDNHFRIIRELTVEETLDEMNIMYGPDENIQTSEYESKYVDVLFSDKIVNMGFFHGNFDILTNSAAVESIKNNNLPTVIFDYNLLKNLIHGPIVASHQHKHVIIHPLYNIGSYSRWEFDQEGPKGFAFIQYDTETCNFMYKQIENLFTPVYDTYEFRTSDFASSKEMVEFVNVVKHKATDDPKAHIRVKVIVDDDREDKMTFVSGIKDYFLNTRRVKVTITNAKKQKEIEHEKKEVSDRICKYEYITSNKLSVTEILQRYLKEDKNVDIPMDVIDKYVKQYLK